jgi:hypothetical protein
LPQIEIDIPFRAELDLAPLVSAWMHRPEQDGRWWRLRERFAHLGLAQGFDELLCLPHLVGVEPLTHQIESVRKVLKQFHGRVLLADEVGLGKTIEAGMVLKEYLLRGMVERVLVLAPAALVGQWREELETKFGLSCATTQEDSLRDDPDGFWNQKRIIASIALARRRSTRSACSQAVSTWSSWMKPILRDRASQTGSSSMRSTSVFCCCSRASAERSDRGYNLLTLLKPHLQDGRGISPAYMTPVILAGRQTRSACAS